MDGKALTEQVRSTYDAVAEVYAARFPSTEPEQPIDLAMIDHFLSVLPAGGAQVLDSGCGTGRMSRYVSDRGCRVRGVDLSPGMIAVARREHADISTQVASITDLPFPDAEFDGVLLWYSVIHIADEDLPAVFREARRVLRPGGFALIAFQSGQGSRDVGGGFRALGYDVRLTRFHRTADDVAEMLASAGLAEQARLVRRPVIELDDQAFLVVRSLNSDDAAVGSMPSEVALDAA
ncbi:class I SAM-dependent DNA methyltransferase [uncultured Jatrophihabitans sp.]|uniref:class I SAM-dependent DNA methyltransferase n=1 Tax=uncultured Jatrophihabitans sp. TaxID=1610747 RepID=UPI0035CB829B